MMKKNILIIIIIVILFILTCSGDINDTQNKSASFYTFLPASDLPDQNMLPDPFLKADGTRITSRAEWENQRQYLKAMLTHYLYGEMPPKPDFTVKQMDSNIILNGQLFEILYKMIITRGKYSIEVRFGLRRPNKRGKFPIIIKNDRFVFNLKDIEGQSTRDQYAEQGRDITEMFVAEEAVKRNYIICKFIRDDVAADNRDSRKTGVFTLYPEYNWGTITTWAWFYSLLIDFFESQDYVDIDKIVVTGHSRGGKTALCAGIYDQRIAITVPNSSGTGGTGSWKFFDEDQNPQLIKHHKQTFPYWWTDTIFDFVDKESKLPFDSHFHKVLIAPRAILNPHAREDYWANPYGTYLTYLAAQKVFDWLEVPENNAVHWRPGGHDQNEQDWLALFDYCDKIFFNKPTHRNYTESHDLNFKNNPKYKNWPSLHPWEVPSEE